jgi:hypothetical protein
MSVMAWHGDGDDIVTISTSTTASQNSTQQQKDYRYEMAAQCISQN